MRVFIVIAAIVVACVGVFSLFARAMKRARARISGCRQTIETSFGTIEYAKIGDAQPVSWRMVLAGALIRAST